MNKILCILSFATGFGALTLLALAGPSYRLQWLELGQAFMLMRAAVVLGVLSLPVVIVYSIRRKPEGRLSKALAFSALAGLCAAYIPFSQMQTAKSVPPIHDISTDLENPPEFVDIKPLRADAPNPAEYAGPDTAQQQRQAYPNIQPLIVDQPLSDVYEAAVKSAKALGWKLVSAEEEQGSARIEATDTTFWFGFKDDVVIRLQTDKEGTRVDVRSKSRVGKSDVGKNAERIQNFLDVLKQQLVRP